MPALDKDIIGKAADWIGQAADEAGKQLGHDETQESAALVGRIVAAVIARLVGAAAPLVAGASRDGAAIAAKADELIEAVRAGG